MRMSQRLQVLFDEEELDEIRAVARRNRMTVAEWVRQTLRAALRQQPRDRIARKLAVVEASAEHQFPTAGIDTMLEEIARGYEAR